MLKTMRTDKSDYSFVSLEDMYKHRGHNPKILFDGSRRHSAGFPFWFRPIMAMLEFLVENYIDAWLQFLSGWNLKAFITTNATGLELVALVSACHEKGVPVICLQKGIPVGGPWKIPFADHFIVWSRLGYNMLKTHGWPINRINICNYPYSIPDDGIEKIRRQRRAELSLDFQDVCILAVGQPSVEWGIYHDEGSAKSFEMMAVGLSAMEKRGYKIILRPHPADNKKENEKLFVKEGFHNLIVSGGVASEVSIQEDIAASDIVVGYNSTSMEEAWLMKKPTIQVVPESSPISIDFRCIGASLARSAEQLIEIISNGPKPDIPIEENSSLIKLIESYIGL